MLPTGKSEYLETAARRSRKEVLPRFIGDIGMLAITEFHDTNHDRTLYARQQLHLAEHPAPDFAVLLSD